LPQREADFIQPMECPSVSKLLAQARHLASFRGINTFGSLGANPQRIPYRFAVFRMTQSIFLSANLQLLVKHGWRRTHNIAAQLRSRFPVLTKSSPDRVGTNLRYSCAPKPRKAMRLFIKFQGLES
jgi:hypothetical protein